MTDDEKLTAMERDQVESELKALRVDEAALAAILFGDNTADKGFREIADEMRTALAYLDAIIAAYQTTNAIGQMLIAIREAKEWRGVRTSQDASGATQSP